MLYDPEMTRPMKEELTNNGFEDLNSTEAVDKFLENKEETQLIVVNSVCGCAAGGARPGALLAIQKAQDKKPARVGTVFAGVDTDATAHARGYFNEFPPSSPSMTLFKEGKPVHFVPRHMIEGRDPEIIAQDLVQAFQEHC